LKQKTEDVNTKLQEVGSQVYQQAQQEQANQQAGAGAADQGAQPGANGAQSTKPKDGEKVVDAEFEEKDDGKTE